MTRLSFALRYVIIATGLNALWENCTSEVWRIASGMMAHPFHVDAGFTAALASAAGRHTCRSFLAKLLDQVVNRHTTTLDYEAMGHALEISAGDVRVLWPSVREKITKRHLTRCALTALSYDHHADIVVNTIDKRAKHRVEIASAYTSDELFCEPGVGQVSVTKIHLRPNERGASLRSPY